jgi:1-deoxy-D-xylulose-5-phosphate reductoisomerase
LELIEAHFLFDTPADRIEVWIHPQSVVHGAIWLVDNTCLAQLSRPDMCSAIGYAMSYPSRLEGVIQRLGLSEMARLEFLSPDENRFPALRLAREALSSSPSHLVQLNSSDEVAVESFIEGRLLFSQIPELIAETLELHQSERLDSVEAVFEADKRARELATKVVQRMAQ